MGAPHLQNQNSDERLQAHKRGARAELLAAVYLTCKGYRVLARRYKTHLGEIDLIARRGRRIVFIEVKQRPSFAQCEAAVTGETRRRVHRAAELWLGKNRYYRDFDQGFDLVFIAAWQAPRHLLNAL